MIRARVHRPLGAAEPKQGGLGMLYLVGGLAAAWAAWALLTPHEEYGRRR